MKENNNTMKYSVINLSANVPSYPRFFRHTKGWINFGEDNNLPQRIIDLNNESAVNKSIIENKVTYICGAGIDDAEYCGRPNTIEQWDDLIEKLAKDYATFGGFCFQVIVNENGTSTSLFHTDFSKVRVGETDDYGTPQSFFISNDWRKISGQYSPVELKAYGTEELKQGEAYLYFYKDYEPGLDYYPVPHYYVIHNFLYQF